MPKCQESPWLLANGYCERIETWLLHMADMDKSRVAMGVVFELQD